MKILVKYFAGIRENVGKRSEEVEVKEGSTIREVISLLSETHGTKFRDLVLDGDELREHVNVLVDGRSMRVLEGLDTKIARECVLAIFPAVGGG